MILYGSTTHEFDSKGEEETNVLILKTYHLYTDSPVINYQIKLNHFWTSDWQIEVYLIASFFQLMHLNLWAYS